MSSSPSGSKKIWCLGLSENFTTSSIDKVNISDLDKKRILKYIDLGLKQKGLTRSDSPDIVVSIETTSRQRFYLRNNLAYGYYPPFWGFYNHPSSSVTSNTQGTLFINIIDAKNNQLVWQGRGVGIINEFRRYICGEIYIYIRG